MSWNDHGGGLAWRNAFIVDIYEYGPYYLHVSNSLWLPVYFLRISVCMWIYWMSSLHFCTIVFCIGVSVLAGIHDRRSWVTSLPWLLVMVWSFHLFRKWKKKKRDRGNPRWIILYVEMFVLYLQWEILIMKIKELFSFYLPSRLLDLCLKCCTIDLTGLAAVLAWSLWRSYFVLVQQPVP